MSTLLDHIGNTPLIEIKHLNPNPNVKIYAKMEGFNPGGSVKDRIALAMIEHAESIGALTKDKTIIEATSGNTGIGIAMIAAIKGYKTVIVMPETMSLERRKVIKAYGAELILVKREMWRQGALNMIAELMEHDKSLITLDQFANEENCAAHYRDTGKEILKQIDGPIDYFIAGVGTGGTITGVSRRLREKYPDLRVIGLQPKIWEKIEGLMSTKKNVTPILKPNLPCGEHSKALIDIIIEVAEQDAYAAARELALKEGIFAGASSGAAMWAVLQYAQKIEKGTIVTIFPDRGERYLSTEVFNDQKG